MQGVTQLCILVLCCLAYAPFTSLGEADDSTSGERREAKVEVEVGEWEECDVCLHCHHHPAATAATRSHPHRQHHQTRRPLSLERPPPSAATTAGTRRTWRPLNQQNHRTAGSFSPRPASISTSTSSKMRRRWSEREQVEQQQQQRQRHVGSSLHRLSRSHHQVRTADPSSSRSSSSTSSSRSSSSSGSSIASSSSATATGWQRHRPREEDKVTPLSFLRRTIPVPGHQRHHQPDTNHKDVSLVLPPASTSASTSNSAAAAAATPPSSPSPGDDTGGAEPGWSSRPPLRNPPARFTVTSPPTSNNNNNTTTTTICNQCRGCTAVLGPMVKHKTFLGSNFTMEVGSSTASHFLAHPLGSGGGGNAGDGPVRVVKAWCLPKQRQDGSDYPGAEVCTPRDTQRFSATMQKLVAMQRLSDECGLSDITPRVTVERLRALTPVSRTRPSLHTATRKLNIDALMFDVAEQVSLNVVVWEGKPRMDRTLKVNLLRNINSNQVVQAALYDLLFSQCDRHPQNVFINETSHITLIDNDQGFAQAWKPCQVDSMFLPSTYKFEIARVGFFYLDQILNNKTITRQPKPDPTVMLDYRCHAPGGEIGTRFPHSVKMCMEKFSTMPVRALQREFQLPQVRHAVVVKQRAHDMLSRGFEEALRIAGYRHKSTLFPLHVPCCNLRYNETLQAYICIPKGDVKD